MVVQDPYGCIPTGALATPMDAKKPLVESLTTWQSLQFLTQVLIALSSHGHYTYSSFLKWPSWQQYPGDHCEAPVALLCATCVG